MSELQIGGVILVVTLVVLFSGLPIAWGLTLVAVGFLLLLKGPASLANVPILMMDELSSFALLTIPLFVLLGAAIGSSAAGKDIYESLHRWLDRVPGGLVIANILACGVFSAICGSSPATAAAIGKAGVPEMIKRGVSPAMATGSICAGGTLGILIPPSIMLIVYAAMSATSVVKLYAAALLPGFLLAGLYIAYVIIRATLNPKLMPKLPKEEVADISFLEMVVLLTKAFFPLAVLILSVLGAILFGLATPTEAAAVGAFGGLILAAAYRSLSWPRLKEAVFLTARTSAMVCWLFVGSAIFSSVFGYLGGQELVEQFFKSLPLNTFTFMLLAQALIFVLGWPLEWTEIIVIFVPIFLPLLDDFGVDPLFFGVLVALNLQTSFLSPPVAMAAFYLKGVAPPHVTLNQIFAGMLPFMGIQVVALALLYIFPDIGMWLPKVLYGN